MANTTFSGPIRSGTVREGPNANIGWTVLNQGADFTFADTGTFASGIILPAGAEVLSIFVNLYEAWNSATSDAMEIGSLADPDAIADVADLQTTGQVAVTAAVSQLVTWKDIGTVDLPIYLTINSVGGGLNAGDGRINIRYRQQLSVGGGA